MNALTTDSGPSQTAMEKVKALQARALALTVVDQGTYELAADFTKQVRTARTKLEAERKEIVKPFNDGVKAINARFAALTAPLDKIETNLRMTIGDYTRAEAERRRKETEAAALEEATIAEVSGDEAGVTAILDDAAAQNANVKVIARSDLGTLATTQRRWTFEVVSLHDVPRDWLTLNESAVRQAIKDGARAIPGLRIYQAESVVIR